MPALFKRKHAPNIAIPLAQLVEAVAETSVSKELQTAAGAVVRLLQITEGRFVSNDPLHGLLRDTCGLVVALDIWLKGTVVYGLRSDAAVRHLALLVNISDDFEKKISQESSQQSQDELTTIIKWRAQLDNAISVFELNSVIELHAAMAALEVPALRNLMQKHMLFYATSRVGCTHNYQKVSGVLDDLVWWVKDIESSTRLLWLSGVGGIGKTAVCQELRKQLLAAGVAVSVFFISRSLDQTFGMQLVSTLIFQIALIHPAVFTALEKAVERNKDIFSQGLHVQFKTLFLSVLREASPALSSPILFVIDGLDECVDRDTKSSFLRLCYDSLPQLSPLIKIIIASRPEAEIAHVVYSVDESLSTHFEFQSNSRLVPRTLTSGFNAIQSEQSVPDNWPSEAEMETVTRFSSSVAMLATVMDYMRVAKGGPVAALEYIKACQRDRDHGKGSFYDPYRLILKTAHNLPLVRRVLELVVFHELVLPGHRLTTQMAANILRGTNIAEINDALQDVTPMVSLESLKTQWDPNGQIQTISFSHSSIADFFSHVSRENAFFLDMGRCSTRTIAQCLCLLADNGFLTQRFHRGSNKPDSESFSMSERSMYHTILCRSLLLLACSMDTLNVRGIHNSLLSYDYSDINISFGYERINLSEYLVSTYRILITACDGSPDLIAHFQSIHQKCLAVVPGFKEYVESEAVYSLLRFEPTPPWYLFS